MTRVEVLNGGNLKVGDTGPNLRVKLYDGEDPFNLDGYTVNVKIKRTDSDSAVVDASATVATANRGIVEYSWSSGDTDTSGVYLAEFTADNGSGHTVTFPNDEYARLYIDEKL